MRHILCSNTGYGYGGGGGSRRTIDTALMAEEPGSSVVDAGKFNWLARMFLTSKLPSQDFKNSFSRTGHLSQKQQQGL